MASTKTAVENDAAPCWATAALVLADGAVFGGKGIGAAGHAVGEVCFNTSMTGYQEIITDPSYAGQIITFTFPHIGYVGVNDEVTLAQIDGSVVFVVLDYITAPSNFPSPVIFVDLLKGMVKIVLAVFVTRSLSRPLPLALSPHSLLAPSPLR